MQDPNAQSFWVGSQALAKEAWLTKNTFSVRSYADIWSEPDRKTSWDSGIMATNARLVPGIFSTRSVVPTSFQKHWETIKFTTVGDYNGGECREVCNHGNSVENKTHWAIRLCVWPLVLECSVFLLLLQSGGLRTGGVTAQSLELNFVATATVPEIVTVQGNNCTWLYSERKTLLHQD